MLESSMECHQCRSVKITWNDRKDVNKPCAFSVQKSQSHNIVLKKMSFYPPPLHKHRAHNFNRQYQHQQTLRSLLYMYKPSPSKDQCHELYCPSGPSIKILIPFPSLTSANAFSASSNLTLPVISSLTLILPPATRSMAVW